MPVLGPGGFGPECCGISYDPSFSNVPYRDPSTKPMPSDIDAPAKASFWAQARSYLDAGLAPGRAWSLLMQDPALRRVAHAFELTPSKVSQTLRREVRAAGPSDVRMGRGMAQNGGAADQALVPCLSEAHQPPPVLQEGSGEMAADFTRRVCRDVAAS